MSDAGSLATSRIKKELEEIRRKPVPNVSVGPKIEECMYEWEATIAGREGSVYEGGVFKLDITFSKHHPFEPPRVWMRTKIYHCNISEHGFICLGILGHNWTAALTISKVLLSISSLLNECNPENPIRDVIAIEYLENRAEHDKKAREWTEKYAG